MHSFRKDECNTLDRSPKPANEVVPDVAMYKGVRASFDALVKTVGHRPVLHAMSSKSEGKRD